jgi:hypothetical protein
MPRFELLPARRLLSIIYIALVLKLVKGPKFLKDAKIFKREIAGLKLEQQACTTTQQAATGVAAAASGSLKRAPIAACGLWCRLAC